MSSVAIVMLIVSITLIWGGLGVALVHLSRHPDDSSGEAETSTPAPWAADAAQNS
ncbi:MULTISPECIES: methionine/alanine import family NSS transporter small subunit [Rothia]|uniref:methionine/alanine import family NSS transporter small subunit n=1 Tax=Rothia TaxID=32207 RepID=UPI0009F61A8A|nr:MULTISPECIES: methionine/alanine import family NSS transporter small subunit [Rothia]